MSASYGKLRTEVRLIKTRSQQLRWFRALCVTLPWRLPVMLYVLGEGFIVHTAKIMSATPPTTATAICTIMQILISGPKARIYMTSTLEIAYLRVVVVQVVTGTEGIMACLLV